MKVGFCSPFAELSKAITAVITEKLKNPKRNKEAWSQQKNNKNQVAFNSSSILYPKNDILHAGPHSLIKKMQITFHFIVHYLYLGVVWLKTAHGLSEYGFTVKWLEGITLCNQI